jgi:hypothetical protein
MHVAYWYKRETCWSERDTGWKKKANRVGKPEKKNKMKRNAQKETKDSLL